MIVSPHASSIDFVIAHRIAEEVYISDFLTALNHQTAILMARNQTFKMAAEFMLYVSIFHKAGGKQEHTIRLFLGQERVVRPDFFLVRQVLQQSCWVDVPMEKDGSWVIDDGVPYTIRSKINSGKAPR